MDIKIYGSGCAKCVTLAENVKTALAGSDIAASVEKVSDIDAIVSRGILTSPALEIDGEIVSSGRILSPDEIRKLIPGASAPADDATRSKSSAVRHIVAAALVLFAFAGIVWPIMRDRNAAQSTAAQPAPPSTKNVTTLYYFHGTQRCVTCNKIEAQTRAVAETKFAAALADGTLRFKSVNVDEPANEHFVSDFQLTSGTVVVRRGTDYKRLDDVWKLVHDEAAFTRYIQDGVAAMLMKE